MQMFYKSISSVPDDSYDGITHILRLIPYHLDNCMISSVSVK